MQSSGNIISPGYLFITVLETVFSWCCHLRAMKWFSYAPQVIYCFLLPDGKPRCSDILQKGSYGEAATTGPILIDLSFSYPFNVNLAQVLRHFSREKHQCGKRGIHLYVLYCMYIHDAGDERFCRRFKLSHDSMVIIVNSVRMHRNQRIWIEGNFLPW